MTTSSTSMVLRHSSDVTLLVIGVGNVDTPHVLLVAVVAVIASVVAGVRESGRRRRMMIMTMKVGLRCHLNPVQKATVIHPSMKGIPSIVMIVSYEMTIVVVVVAIMTAISHKRRKTY
jgi:hypothetical protein